MFINNNIIPVKEAIAFEKNRKSLDDDEQISSPKASNGQRFPCPALLSPWFSWGEAGQRPG